MSGPIVAGWKEYADFPEWGLRRVKVKLDTGARSAAIGVRLCAVIDKPDGTHEAELHLAPYRRNPHRVTVVRVPVLGFKVVKSSHGSPTIRPVVEVLFRLGPVTRRVRATVSDRTGMLVPVLLGRLALAPEFVVDPGRKYMLNPDSPQRHKAHTKDHQEDEKEQ
jgi:hypothetical protein